MSNSINTSFAHAIKKQGHILLNLNYYYYFFTCVTLINIFLSNCYSLMSQYFPLLAYNTHCHCLNKDTATWCCQCKEDYLYNRMSYRLDTKENLEIHFTQREIAKGSLLMQVQVCPSWSESKVRLTDQSDYQGSGITHGIFS